MGKKRAFLYGLMIMVLLMSTLARFGVQPAQADGGAYTIAFSAADPKLYIPPVPLPDFIPPLIPQDTNLDGIDDYRYDGETLIPEAWYTQPGGTKTSIESLNPREMALCQIVPFEIEISVGVGAEAIDEPITFVAGWNIDTTNNDLFGYDPAYKVYSAFVDIGDGSHVDPGGDATVSYTSSVVGDEIQGVFTVYGLDAGDVVVVEPWLVLDCNLPAKVGGNVQSRLISAQTATGDTISTGNQTVPLLQVGKFTSTAVDLSVVKSDDGVSKRVGEYFWFDLTVSFPSDGYVDTIANQVIVNDTLDPWLDYLSDDPISTDPTYGYSIFIGPFPGTPRTGTCSWVDDDADGLGGTVTCDLGAVVEGEVTTIRFWVKSVEGVEVLGLVENGTCTQGNPNLQGSALVDVCNLVSLTTISNDTNLTNNSDSEPKDIGLPTSVELTAFEAEALTTTIKVSWETLNEVEILGFNLFRTINPDGSGLTKLNQAIISADYSGSNQGGLYEFIDDQAEFGVTYYYKLEVIYTDSSTKWLEPVYATLNYRLFLPLTVR